MPGRLDPEPVARRDFLGWAGLLSSGLAVFGSILGMARLPKPRVLPEGTSRFRVGKPAAFPPGTAKIIPEQNVRIVATEEGVAAMSLVCTHLGCIPVPYLGAYKGWVCLCHGSVYDKFGRVRQGPAQANLPYINNSVYGPVVCIEEQQFPNEPSIFLYV